jgi:ATP-binding protein involved in chromosome partitioning
MKQNQEQQEALTQNLSSIKHIIAVLSGKGGVGKSTVATHLALALSEKNHSVGLLDCDIHGPTIPTLLGLESERIQATTEGFTPIQATEHLKVLSMGFLINNKDDPIIWRGPMKMGAIRQLLGDFNWGNLDYLIIDLPPGTGDEPLTIAQLIPKLTGAVVVTTPQDVALISVRKSITFVKKIKIPVLGLIENMSGFSCPHCGEEINIFKKGGGEQAATEFDIPFLGSIPLDPHIVTKGDMGGTILDKDDTITLSLHHIVTNIEKELEKKGE